ncbi:MAG: SBBP repeat-containing protein [Bacteroidota bacterium]
MMKNKLLIVFMTCMLYTGIQAQPAFVWARGFASTSTSNTVYGNSVTTDSAGNVYTTGYFWGTADFDPGPSSYPLTSAGNDDVYVTKIDASGNLVWAVRFGGTSADYGWGIAADSAGNVFVTGVFYNTVDFDPGAGSYPLTSAGAWDVFVLKLSTAGTFVWADRIGGTNNDYGYTVALDTLGNVYSGGWFNGTADFNPGTGVYNLTSTGGDNAFVCKLNSAGNFVWARQMGSAGTDRIYSVAVDYKGNVNTAGYFTGTSDFNPGAGTFNMTSSGMEDIFVTKLDSAGNFKWASHMGGLQTDWCFGLALDAEGCAYTTGMFIDSADFDPGVGVFKLKSKGSGDIFVTKLDTSGNLDWAVNMGSTNDEMGRCIRVDKEGNTHLTGYYSGTTDFDPGVDVFNLTPVSGYDVFYCTLDTGAAFVCAGSMGGSGSTDYGFSVALNKDGYAFFTGSYSGSGDFNPGTGVQTLTAFGTTNAYLVKLVACMPCKQTNLDTTFTVCNSYTSPSGDYVWTVSGTYNDTIPNAAQCDSVITFHLTVLYSTSCSFSQTSCGSYTVPSGDETYYTNGTVKDTIPNAAGCDSVLTINLTIVNVNTSVTQVGSTLTSSQNGATYQWMLCPSYAYIGAVSQSLTPTMSGLYAVEVTYNGCVDTSACYPVTIIGVQENYSNNLSISPNPSTGTFTLEFNESARIEIFNAQGSLVFSEAFEKGKHTVSFDAAESIYLLKASNDKGSVVHRIVIQK